MAGLNLSKVARIRARLVRGDEHRELRWRRT